LALKPTASKHAYLCAHPVIGFSPFQSHLTFVLSSRYSGRFLQRCFLLVCHMAILVNLARGLRFTHCAFDVALSPPRSALTALCPISYPSSLLHWVWLACCGLRRFLFHRLQTDVALRLFSLSCTKPPNTSTCPSFRPGECSCSDSDRLSHTTTVGPSSSPQKFRSPRPAD